MNYLATPLVTVAGVPNAPPSDASEAHPLYAAQQLERVMVCEQTATATAPLAAVAAGLAKLSVDSPQWDPQLLKRDRLHFRFSNFVDLPVQTAKPSVLSPKHRQCEHAIFSPYWVEKYHSVQPCVTIAVFDAPDAGSPAEEDLAASLNGLVDELGQSGGTLLMAVISGPPEKLAHTVPFLRRETDLSQPSRLLALPNTLSDEETAQFINQLFYATTQTADAFFRAKFDALRRKRENVAPPLDLMVWDARYTLKLAFCAEFRGDVNSAMRLYESAYDSLALLFEKGAITPETPAYANARECLDLIALKMFHHSLPLKLAYRKLMQHIDTVVHILQQYDQDPSAAAALRWRGEQYAVFAQLCTTYKQIENESQPAGTPTGLVWLDAAELYARAEATDAEATDAKGADSAGADAASVDVAEKSMTATDTQFTPQLCFLNAISDLTEFRRSKAFALMQYGDWLAFRACTDTNGDQSAAAEAYKSARKLLAPTVWPGSERYLSVKLDDKLSLFALGELKEFPKDAKATETPNGVLFTASGNWRSRETHIGRELQAQVTVAAKVPVTADKVVITHSLGTVEFVHEAGGQQDLVVAKGSTDSDSAATSSANLAFSRPQTFQFGLTPLETGSLRLESVTVHIGTLSQTVVIGRATNQWVTSLQKPPQHLDLTLDPRQAEVTTRPAKVKFGDLTPAVAALGEQFKFVFDVTSNEDEQVDAELSVDLVTVNDEPSRLYTRSTTLAPGSPLRVDGRVAVPKSLFELKFGLKFNTSQDTLPVTFEFTKEVDVLRPFRVTFDVAPLHHEHAWPAVFAPEPDLKIPRKWRLTSTCLASFEQEPLLLHSVDLEMDSSAAEFALDAPASASPSEMPYNSVKRVSRSFLAWSTQPPSAVRNFEAAANIRLRWSRQSSPDIVNTLVLPPVRLNLPTQEPRVLVVCDKAGGSAEPTQVTYHLENASSTLLNFSVTMSSSTYFAYQGARVSHVKMLPFSTRKLTYELIPLGDGNVQNRRPLPDLRVFDVNFKHVLPILPGDELVSFDQQTLFI